MIMVLVEPPAACDIAFFGTRFARHFKLEGPEMVRNVLHGDALAGWLDGFGFGFGELLGRAGD
jgi:hypothetical protein